MPLLDVRNLVCGYSCAALLALQACSSSSSSSAPACNDVVDDGATVTGMMVAASAPTPAGGAIADGTYALTALTEYTGPGGATGALGESGSIVLTISGSTMQQAGNLNGQEKSYTTTITASGTTLATMDTCPTPSSGMHSYTATATDLRIYDSVGGDSLEQTYSKR